jgi:hypothetical protein
MIGFWDFNLSGAPPLLSFGVRSHDFTPVMSCLNHLYRGTDS